MAELPDDRVLMVNPNVKGDDGKQIEVEVSRFELESVWSTVGWTLKAPAKSKEK